jgi:hypothetical protein
VLRFATAILCAALPAFASQASQTNAARFFDDRVAPIIEKRCLGCHNEELKNGNISFLDRASLLHGGAHGPAIVPGHPASSLLIIALQHEGELQMPPGPKLSSKDIRIFSTWIKRGAIWGTKLHK